MHVGEQLHFVDVSQEAVAVEDASLTLLSFYLSEESTYPVRHLHAEGMPQVLDDSLGEEAAAHVLVAVFEDFVEVGDELTVLIEWCNQMCEFTADPAFVNDLLRVDKKEQRSLRVVVFDHGPAQMESLSQTLAIAGFGEGMIEASLFKVFVGSIADISSEQPEEFLPQRVVLDLVHL